MDTTRKDKYIPGLRFVFIDPLAFIVRVFRIARHITEVAKLLDANHLVIHAGLVETPSDERATPRSGISIFELGMEIPQELYQAVAEVLAFVWKLKHKI
jgi:type III secretion system FlhB-like substrate exporter